MNEFEIKPKHMATLAGIVGIMFIAMVLVMGGVSTVEKGTYEVRQWPVTGTLDVKATPGMWPKMFSSIDVWPKADTFYFTKDSEDKGESSKDLSIEVRFVDGSETDLSGTCRVLLPTSKNEQLAIPADMGYASIAELHERLIKPIVRNALRDTANMMTARESYAEKRKEFNEWAWDQIQNGLYRTEDEVRQVEDLVSGELVNRVFKVIKRDKQGNPIYGPNPLDGTGIVLTNFEIRKFFYSPKVQTQIQRQQDALMAVETAKAEASKAQQLELTKVAEGKANVAQAKYEQETEKVKAVVRAERDKEVAVLAAQQIRDSNELMAQAASFKKKEQILLGEGEAARKKLVMTADGALAQKLEAYIEVNNKWAEAYAKRHVPTYVMGGGENSGNMDSDTVGFQRLINMSLMKSLNLDTTVK